MGTTKLLSMRSVGVSLVVTAACGLVALHYDTPAGVGILVGGLAGALGFAQMVTMLGKLASVPPDRLQKDVFTWMAYRMALYAGALGFAYALDRRRMYGLLGAAGGILLMRGVFIALVIARQKWPFAGRRL